MYYLLGFEENIRNVAIASKVVSNKAFGDADEIKKAYWEFLRLRMRTTDISTESDRFIFNEPQVRKLIYNYRSVGQAQDEDGIDAYYKNHPQDLTVDGELVNLFQKRHALLPSIDPYLGALNDILVEYYFFTSSSQRAGGSNFTDLGIVWSCPSTGWTFQDYVEILVHEMTHQAIFLDEICHRHYKNKDKLDQPEFHVTSAIRAQKRPFECAVHSSLVSTEILSFRRATRLPEKSLSHGETSHLLKKTQDCLEDIKTVHERYSLMTDRGEHLINQAMARLKEI